MGEARRKRLAVVPDEAFAWHYSDLVRYPFVRMDGGLNASRLMPKGCKVPTTGSRVVWFSTDPRPERTAASVWRNEEFAPMGVPLVRFGLPLAATLPRVEGCLSAGWPVERLQLDAERGRRKGSDPDRWRVVVTDRLPLGE